MFCGSAVGPASARRRAYYAGPGNVFWKTLFEVGLTPRRLEPNGYRELLEYGIGLTDVVKAKAALDRDIRTRDDDAGAVRRKILEYAPAVLAFNGKRAARVVLGRIVEYGKQAETLGATRIVVLPSTSGAARRYWDITYWQELARFVGPLGNHVQ